MCPNCGAANTPQSRFCGQCGTPLVEDAERPALPARPQAAARPDRSGVPLSGERRVITAMFADVKGSTALAERIDVETWVEIMNHVLQVLSAEVHRYGGEVDRYEGDGLVAFFGVPTAHEDDAERAVLAALAMQEAIGRYAADLTQREGAAADLLLRVGLNTGEAIAAHVGDARQHGEDTAMGRAVALAARLEPAAEPGTVLVSENTYRLLAPVFEWQALGQISVKGFSQPVSVYRPLAAKAVPGKGRGIAGLESPLVGRDAEFRALQDAVERLRAGMGGIVTVVGEAGIGKSRLVAEVRKQTLAKVGNPSQGWAVQWVEGRCLSYATGVAYSLWLDWLHSLLGLAAGAPLATVRNRLREWVETSCPERAAEVYPYLARLMSLPPEDEREARVAHMDAESLKGGTFVAVETLVERAVQRQPLVVVCEDLHWADSVSLELLGRLLPLTERAPLLFLCVFRPLREHACWQIRETAARDYEHRHTDLRLRLLSPQESAALVGNLLHVEDLSDDLRARILARAEGNPFFVEEILRALLDEGIIVHDEGADRWFATRDVADIPIPHTVHGVIAARIDRLPEETRRVLQQASVIGRIFTYSLLAAIHSPLPPAVADTRQGVGESEGRGRVSAPETQLSPHLVALQRAQLIRERARLPEREFAFKHVLTQEAAYGGLLHRSRRAIHRHAAEALEKLYPERVEEQLGLLAHHWEQAGETERAVQYLRQAGERAAAQYANEEAIGYLSRALALVPRDDAAARYPLLLAREGVYNVQAARDAQGRDLEALKQAAEALAQRDGGREATRRLAQVALREAIYSAWMRDDDRKSAAIARAIHLAQVVQDPGIEAAAYLEWGRNIGGDPEPREPRVQRALVLARAAQRRRVEADSLRELGMGANNRGDFAAARSYHEEALRVYRDLGDRMGEGRVLDALAWVCYNQGDYAAGIRFSEQGLRLCRETGNRYDEVYATLQIGVGCWCQGDYARARACFGRALPICRKTGDLSSEVFALIGVGATLDALGDYAEAGVWHERAWATGHMGSLRQGTGRVFRSLLCHHRGDDGTARRYAGRALEYYTARTGVPSGRADALTVLGHALAGLGDWAEAASAYRQALDLRQEQGQDHLVPEPLAGLARVALAQGEPGRALAHVGEILRCLEAFPKLEGTWEPLRIYLTCYQVLRANEDPRADDVLHAALSLLQERAATIDDDALRRSYLENVAVNREIVAEFRRVHE